MLHIPARRTSRLWMWYHPLMVQTLLLAFVAVLSLSCAWLAVERVRLKLDNDQLRRENQWHRMNRMAQVKERLPEELKKTRLWRPL